MQPGTPPSNKRPKKRRGFLGCLTRLIVVGVGGFSLFYWWQPWEFDWQERPAPKSNPAFDLTSLSLFSPERKVLIVTAHPDDTEFYIAGTLLRMKDAGVQSKLVVTTDGDKGYYPFEDAARNRRIRQAEQREATTAWGGSDTIFLGFPDGQLTTSEPLIRAIQREIEIYLPDVLMLFDADHPPRASHADHRRTGEATEIAAKRSGFPLTLMRFSTMHGNAFIDVTQKWDQRWDLLAIHKSQFTDLAMGRVRGIIVGSATTAGKRIGVEYAEPFRVTTLPGVRRADPAPSLPTPETPTPPSSEEAPKTPPEGGPDSQYL